MELQVVAKVKESLRCNMTPKGNQKADTPMGLAQSGEPFPRGCGPSRVQRPEAAESPAGLKELAAGSGGAT